jgi:hypothetical protein
MKVEVIFYPTNDAEQSALKLLGMKIRGTDNSASAESFGEPEREHRILGALIDILKLSIIP